MKELFLLLMRILVAVGTIMLTEPSTQNNSVKFVDLPYHWEDREIALNTAGTSPSASTFSTHHNNAIMQYLDHKKHPERFGASVYTPTWEDWEKGQGHYGNYRAVQVPDEIPQTGLETTTWLSMSSQDRSWLLRELIPRPDTERYEDEFFDPVAYRPWNSTTNVLLTAKDTVLNERRNFYYGHTPVGPFLRWIRPDPRRNEYNNYEPAEWNTAFFRQYRKEKETTMTSPGPPIATPGNYSSEGENENLRFVDQLVEEEIVIPFPKHSMTSSLPPDLYDSIITANNLATQRHRVLHPRSLIGEQSKTKVDIQETTTTDHIRLPTESFGGASLAPFSIPQSLTNPKYNPWRIRRPGSGLKLLVTTESSIKANPQKPSTVHPTRSNIQFRTVSVMSPSTTTRQTAIHTIQSTTVATSEATTIASFTTVIRPSTVLVTKSRRTPIYTVRIPVFRHPTTKAPFLADLTTKSSNITKAVPGERTVMIAHSTSSSNFIVHHCKLCIDPEARLVFKKVTGGGAESPQFIWNTSWPGCSDDVNPEPYVTDEVGCFEIATVEVDPETQERSYPYMARFALSSLRKLPHNVITTNSSFDFLDTASWTAPNGLIKMTFYFCYNYACGFNDQNKFLLSNIILNKKHSNNNISANLTVNRGNLPWTDLWFLSTSEIITPASEHSINPDSSESLNENTGLNNVPITSTTIDLSGWTQFKQSPFAAFVRRYSTVWIIFVCLLGALVAAAVFYECRRRMKVRSARRQRRHQNDLWLEMKPLASSAPPDEWV